MNFGIVLLQRRTGLEVELADVKRHLTESESARESLSTRSRRLEEELNTLRRQLQKNKSRENTILYTAQVYIGVDNKCAHLSSELRTY